MAKPEVQDPRAMLDEILADRPDLAQIASVVFDYTQYLLDDDERLTKGGALDGQGRELLCARTLEALGGPAAEEESDEPELDLDDEDDEDDDS
jgi:hypothetical protein